MKFVPISASALLAAVLLLGACTALEPSPPVAEQPSTKPTIITATGEWKPGAKRENELSAAQQKLLASQAAKRDALRNLAAQIDGFRLAEGSTIGALASKNDTARSYVEGLVRSAQVIETKVLPNRATQVRVAVELSPALQPCLLEGKCPPPPGCTGPLRKVLVTAFPLRYPEQIHHGEYMGWPQVTAEELARLFNRGGKLLSTAAPQRFPFDSAQSAPELERKQGVPLVSGWASQAQAQYVVSGIFRDFGTAKTYLIIPERQLVVEAYIHDGNSGALLARREFSRQIRLGGSMPRTMTPGTREFSSSSIGGMYNEVLGELGHWAESTVSCLPFTARVIRAEGKRLHLDVGSDSGVAPGMEFILTRAAAEPVSTASGDVLTASRIPVAGVVVKDVHPRYSIAEVGAQQSQPQAQPGDVLYGL
jgi:hypothetical protein